ncbi:MAG: hypothetical protein IJ493_09955 [Clostridia bacterium]|nr:hypothetical protein [Clostridia bacterium]
MAKKYAKHFAKDMKKLSKQLYSEKGLMLKRTYDITTSVYGHGKEKKPYVTINAKADYKISVVKLIVILMCVFSTLALVALCVKGVVDHCRPKKRVRDYDSDFDWEDEEEIPF